MLVLSRQKDEKVIIGDDIVITIVDIRGDKVRLGIDAPKTFGVHREEIYQIIQREKQREAALLTAQHEGPLESDGGPCGSTIFGGTVKTEIGE